MSRQKNINSKKGFTIIEVVLVLAVAGLIFMMVFLAYPALRRSQNDTQRRDQLSALVTQITQYQANNRNRLPATATEAKDVIADAETGQPDYSNTGWGKFYKDYILAGTDVFEDPNGVPYSLKFATCTQDEGGCKPQSNDMTFDDGSGTSSSEEGEGAVDSAQNYNILITYNATCDGENIIYNSGARKVTVSYRLEGGGTFCQGN